MRCLFLCVLLFSGFVLAAATTPILSSVDQAAIHLSAELDYPSTTTASTDYLVDAEEAWTCCTVSRGDAEATSCRSDGNSRKAYRTARRLVRAVERAQQ